MVIVSFSHGRSSNKSFTISFNTYCWTKSVVPGQDETAPSWSHLRQHTPNGIILGTDELAVASAKDHFAEIARRSTAYVKNKIAWDALQKADVISLEENGNRVRMKFGPHGEPIYPAGEAPEEASGAA